MLTIRMSTGKALIGDLSYPHAIEKTGSGRERDETSRTSRVTQCEVVQFIASQNADTKCRRDRGRLIMKLEKNHILSI